MSTTLGRILQQNTPEIPQENNADAKPVQHANGGTTPTQNEGEAPVNDGSAVVGGQSPEAKEEAAPVQPQTYNNGDAQAPVTKPKDAPSITGGTAGDTDGGTAAPAGGAQKKMSYMDILNQMYKQPSKEDIEKERKKAKRDKIFAAIGDGIAALSNLYFTTQGAPNAFDAKNSLSAKAKERWDKVEKDREAENKAYFNAYMQAAKTDAEEARDERNWKRQLERDEKADKQWQAQFDQNKDQWQKSYDRQKERDEVQDKQWQQSFNEGKRQFSVSSSQSAQRINMESKRLAKEMQGDDVSFALGTGKGTVSVPKEALNASNVSYVFSKLPDEVKATCKGEAVYDSKHKKVVGHKAPTTEAMLICIGANIESSAEAQNALREIGGQQVSGGKKVGLK